MAEARCVIEQNISGTQTTLYPETKAEYVNGLDSKIDTQTAALNTKLTGDINTVNTNLTNSINTTNSTLTTKINAVDSRVTATNTEVAKKASQAQVDASIATINTTTTGIDNRLAAVEAGGTAQSDEVVGIRSGADGINYQSAGQAVQSQFRNKASFSNVKEVPALQTPAQQWINDINAAGTKTKSDIDAKAESTIASIPDDYTTLSNEVTDLKSDLNQFYTDTNIERYYINLFDINDPDFLDGKSLSNSGTITNNGNHTVTGFIPVELNRPLYPSYNGVSKTVLHLCEYDSSKNFINHRTYFGAGTVIKNENTKYIRCVAPKDYGDINKFQIQYDKTTAFVSHRLSYKNADVETVKEDISVTNDSLDKFVEDSGMEKKISRNLFDVNSPDTLVGKTISTSGVIAANSNHVVSPFIEVELNRPLNPSYNGTAHTVLSLCEYDANKVFIQGSQYFSNGKIITNSSTKYIRFAIPKDYGDYTKFQLEYDKVTPFVRYGTIYEKKTTENIITVKSNGTGDFTSLRQAIEYANNHAPCKIKLDSDTTYTLEFTESEINNAGYPKGFYGVEVKSNVHIIGGSIENVINTRTVIKATIPTTVSRNLRDAISTLNLNGSNITIENVRIEAENIRYAVHDDYPNNANAYHCFKNCEIVSINGTNGAAYGAGSRTGQVTDIIGCTITPHLVWHTGSEGYYRKSVFNIEDTIINGYILIQDYDNGGKLCELSLKNVKYTSLNYELKGSHAQQISVNGLNNAISPIKYNSSAFVFNTDEVKNCLADVDITSGKAVKLTGPHSVAIAENSNVFYGIALESAKTGEFVKVQTNGYVNTLRCGITVSVGNKIGVTNGNFVVTEANEIGIVKFADSTSGYFKLK